MKTLARCFFFFHLILSFNILIFILFLIMISPQRYEDGTVDFLNIIAVKYGIKQINKLGMQNISDHTKKLSDFLCKSLKNMRHSNGMNSSP